MPVSTDRHSGFPVSKWELKYLRCRYVAHRNKIAAAKPAIDAKPPPERPHVRYKKKKALEEERRQLRVVQENLRILDRTMNIMAADDMPTQFSSTRTPSSQTRTLASSTKTIKISAPDEAIVCVIGSGSSSPVKLTKYHGRPLTARLKRNTHIIFRWFIQRFGKYVPWWAEINY